ncbi:GNAT family N-acetyltransferase [Georgenia sp. SYP-B2076]|uniref:GNAT family N-acetyltransferase n=1 Tax=Georgenia sp. SYP-B2076 TaxID=2495881 RepID=UPI001F0B99B4|nr:GNAT family N-acetyltransferase [Georgenia sp. SYP-B2076]
MNTHAGATEAIAPHVSLPAGYRLAVLDDEADRSAMLDVDEWAFAEEPEPDDAAVMVWPLEPGRSVGVWDERDGASPRLVATHSSYAFALPVPGGARVPTAGLTWVSVHPGHRRRGLARGMLTAHLRGSLARGEVLSTLNAAEVGIYGRYGYGVATQHLHMTLPRGAAMREVAGADELVVDLDRADAARHGPLVDGVHRAVDRPGWITRDSPALRGRPLRDRPSDRRGAEALRIAVVRAPAGEPRGYALFRRRSVWSGSHLPQGVVQVREAVALDAAAARALWAALVDLDLMGTVETGHLAPDDALHGLLLDHRAAQAITHDDVWLRLLDVPAALAARRYQAGVDVVLEVRDAVLASNDGRWRLRGGPDGATAERTDEPAGLALDVADLASAYLGGTTLGALALAARVTELVPGTLAPASAAFAWPVAPATSWGF